jgi:hypothetical protein
MFALIAPTAKCNNLPSLVITELNSVALVRERTIPTERSRLLAKLVPTFADRGSGMVSATDSHVVVNLGFLDRSRYFSFQIALHGPKFSE